MKTNKTIKWLLAVGLVAVIAGCDGSGSGKSGSKDGSAAGLNMLDLTTVDQEALAKQIHAGLTKETILNGCSVGSVRVRESKYIEPNAKKVEEGLESGPCEYGGSKNVIENVEVRTSNRMEKRLEVEFDHCRDISTGSGINGYMKEHNKFLSNGGDVIEVTYLNVYKDGMAGWDDYICTSDILKGTSLEVATGHDVYKYSLETKRLNLEDAKTSYNIDGYKTYMGGFVHVKADAIIETIYDKGCRTDGVVHLTGKNNSKVTIQYNADRSMDFTLNGKTEHWYNCMQKNP